jgi:hypothetical protein
MEIRRFNWTRRKPLWQQMQAWRESRAQALRRFLDNGAAASTTFANAQVNLSSGMASIAAQTSLQRTQKDIALRSAQVNKLA